MSSSGSTQFITKRFEGIQAIAFDLDGTLVDSASGLAAAMTKP